MVLELYKNKSEINSLTRELSNKITLNGSLKGETDVLNPIVMVETNNISDYNYAFIPEFSRFYFIKVENVRDTIWRITGNVDALYTYKNEILNLEAIIDKQENELNVYFDDGSFINETRSVVEIANYSGGFNDNMEFILITAGA